jgi:hypothetical protein
VLLLGSYDKKTKTVLDSIKEELQIHFAGKLIVAVLSNLEIFDTDKFQVLAEIDYTMKQMSLFLIDKDGFLQEAHDMPIDNSQKVSETINDFLMKKYNVAYTRIQLPAAKLDNLMKVAGKIFLIREKTETRGGEYIELMYALHHGYSAKIVFCKKDSIKLSGMLMEYMDIYNVNLRTYKNIRELNRNIGRIVEYHVCTE